MLSKEECEEALKQMTSSCEGNEDFCLKNCDACSVIKQLINEHFDNPPLKFEELEVGMVVWDNIEKKFVQIGPFCPIDEYYWIYSFGTDIFEYAVKNEFEENRFYKHEVKDNAN